MREIASDVYYVSIQSLGRIWLRWQHQDVLHAEVSLFIFINFICAHNHLLSHITRNLS